MSRFLFFDIDGTLAGASRRILPCTRWALEDARRRGHRVFVCTGRVPASVVGDIRELQFDGMICGAGSFVTAGGNYIYEHYLDQALLQQVIRCFKENGVLFSLEARDVVYQSAEISEFFNEKWAKRTRGNAELARFHDQVRRGENRVPLERFHPQKDRVAKLGFVCMDKERFRRCVPFLQEQFQIVVFSGEAEPYLNGEIFLKTCTKGDGVRRIVEYFRGSMENTVGFGDSMNDYAMLQTTAVSVCYERAPEKLKEISGFFFREPDEGGIYDAMRGMGLCGKIPEHVPGAGKRNPAEGQNI